VRLLPPTQNLFTQSIEAVHDGVALDGFQGVRTEVWVVCLEQQAKIVSQIRYIGWAGLLSMKHALHSEAEPVTNSAAARNCPNNHIVTVTNETPHAQEQCRDYPCLGLDPLFYGSLRDQMSCLAEHFAVRLAPPDNCSGRERNPGCLLETPEILDDRC